MTRSLGDITNQPLQQQQIQEATVQNNTDASQIQNATNSELGQVKPASSWALTGRILLGVFTFGLSEGIRALVNEIKAYNALELKLNPLQYSPENILEGLAQRVNNALPKDYKLLPSDITDLSFTRLQREVEDLQQKVNNNKMTPKQMQRCCITLRNEFVQGKIDILNFINSEAPSELKGKMLFTAIKDGEIKSLSDFKKILNYGTAISTEDFVRALRNSRDNAKNFADTLVKYTLKTFSHVAGLEKKGIIQSEGQSREQVQTVMGYGILKNPGMLSLLSGMDRNILLEVNNQLANRLYDAKNTNDIKNQHALNIAMHVVDVGHDHNINTGRNVLGLMNVYDYDED